MAQTQLPRLSRKEFAETVRSTYPQETSGLTDDEVIEVALQEDPSTQDVLETPEETLFRESGAPAPPALGPQGRSPIPSPTDALVLGAAKAAPKSLQPLVHAARPVIGGALEGLTAGLVKPDLASTDSPTARAVGNVVGGIVPAVAAAALAGPPGLAAVGALQGASMATRTNLDEVERKRQEENAKVAAAGGAASYKPATLTDTLTPKGVARVAGQTVVNAGLNMIPPVLRSTKLGSILTNAMIGAAGAPAPVAVDQAIDQGKVDPFDPIYKDAYRLATTMGMAGGAVAGGLAPTTRRPKPVDLGTDADPKLFYDIPPKKPNDPTGGPKGPEYRGSAQSRAAEGWKTVGDEVYVPDPADVTKQRRVRELRHIDVEGGGKGIEVAFDDGTTNLYQGPVEFAFPMQNRRVVIDPNKAPFKGGDPAQKAPTKPAEPPPPKGLAPAIGEEQIPPSAVFLGWMDAGDGSNAFPLFNIKGGPRDRSTVSLDTLAKDGIPVPDFPTLDAWKATQQAPEVDFRLGMADRLKAQMGKKGEKGAISPDLALHTAAMGAGGLVGGLPGEGEDGFNWSRALIGAGIGLGASTTFRSYFRKIGAEKEIIEGLSTHPSVNEYLKRTAPGSRIQKDLKAAVKSAYENILDNTFTPHALLKREAEDWTARNLGTATPGYFDAAIQALDALTMTKFTIPPKVVERFKADVADVVKDDNAYDRLFRIARLRADIEQRQNDIARRNAGFHWLSLYRQAKAAGDVETARFYRTKLRANPGILQPLPEMMRGNIPPDHAIATLAKLEQEAARHHPDVLRAAENWKAWGQDLANDLDARGVGLGEDTRRQNQNYFPNYDLSRMGQSGRMSVGSSRGIGKSARVGFMKRRDVAKPDQKLWQDLAGPYMTRGMSQHVALAELDTARTILNHYDPYRNGTLPPDQRDIAPKGDYTPWSFSIPGEAGAEHGKEWGWVPTPVAAELQRHFVKDNDLQKFMDGLNSYLKGYLIRGSGGGFILNNFIGNTADMYFSTPVSQWPSLTLAGAESIAATILEGVSGPLARRGVTLSPELQAIAARSEEGRKAGIGTEAAAAEITSQAINDPAIAEKAIDPNTPKRLRATDAALAPLKAWGRSFDTIRQATENVTRLAHFIHLVSNNNVDPKQAGRIVNMVQGDYNPTNQTVRERDIKRFALFWTFYKNALPNWLPLLGREVAYGTEIHGGRGMDRLKTLIPHAKKLGAISAVGLGMNLWNHLFFPDAEASLTEHQRQQAHLILPDFWGKNGPWDYKRQQWNLAYHGAPTPMTMAHSAIGLGGIQNRIIHNLRGTTQWEDETERWWNQVKEFWGGLAHPMVGIAGALINGKDPITGQAVVEPGSTGWQAATQIATYPAKGLPGLRQFYQSAREASEPGESAAHFVRRMLTGSLYQPLNRENQEVRALARAVSSGLRAENEEGKRQREAALFRGEQPEWSPEEIRSILTGSDKITWKGKAMALADLPAFLAKSKDIKPSDPGAVDAMMKEAKTTTLDLRKSGPVYLPTRDYLRALGPDATLKSFLETFSGNQRQGDAWRSGALSIVQQLRNESKNWEVPASLMMMLQQSPGGEASTEILRRVHGLERAFDPAIQRGDAFGRKIFQ